MFSEITFTLAKINIIACKLIAMGYRRTIGVIGIDIRNLEISVNTADYGYW